MQVKVRCEKLSQKFGFYEKSENRCKNRVTNCLIYGNECKCCISLHKSDSYTIWKTVL